MKNRGYELERLGEKAGLWRILNNRPFWAEGDVQTPDGVHIQVKTQYGQINCSNWEELKGRLEKEYASEFVVGIEKRGKVELFYFKKQDFIELILNNKDLVKRELKSDRKTYHFRLRFALSKGKVHLIRTASYKRIIIEGVL